MLEKFEVFEVQNLYTVYGKGVIETVDNLEAEID